MPLSLKPPAPLSSALRDSVTYARRAQQQVALGLSDARVASLRPPARAEHFRRFVYGLTLPLTLLRVGWSNPHARSSFWRRQLPPLLLVLLVAAVGAWDIAGAVVDARHDPTALAHQVEADDDDRNDEGDGKEEARERAKREPVARAVLEAREKGLPATEIAGAAIAAAKAEDAARKADAPGKTAAPPVPAPTGLTAALHAIFAFLTSKVAKLIATLSVIEWILVWIGREHHDQIAYETASLTGVPGEKLAAPPRLRLDLAWLKIKGWRAVRLLIFFALASPVAWLAGKAPYVGSTLAVVIQATWAAYWACVFAIGNTPVAWQDTPPVRPWFMRALDRAGRIPLLGFPFRLYARILAKATRGVWAACLAFEAAPFESAGLALARAVSSVPGLYIATRPAFTPAATHAFIARTGPEGSSGEALAEPALAPSVKLVETVEGDVGEALSSEPERDAARVVDVATRTG